MALIKCPECGKEISSDAEKCPNCGYPIKQQQPMNVTVEVKDYHGPFSVLRLLIGICSILLSFLILFQSFFAGLSNALTASGDVGGTAGVMVAMIFIAAGIVAIATRNSRSKGGAITCLILYLFSGLLGMSNSNVYGDLAVWGGLAVIFALIFLIAAIRTKKNPD